MKIIALDQSTTATGLSVYVDGKLRGYMLIKPKSSKRADKIKTDCEPFLINIIMPEEDYGTTLLRITAITDVIETILKQEKPDVVYFEEIYQSRNPKGYRSLARLQGFIAHICHQLGIRYCIIEESKWINYWGTYGSGVGRTERKADIMQKINDLYGLNITVDDISDSIAIGGYAVSIEEKGE